MILNPKRMSVRFQRLPMLMAAIIMALVTFTACEEDEIGDDDPDGNDAQAVTYSGTIDGTMYTLKITEKVSARSYAGEAGDNYTLTASSKKSTGSVTSVNSDSYILKPSNSSNTFAATVSDNSLTELMGTITWSDNSTIEIIRPGLPGTGTYVEKGAVKYDLDGAAFSITFANHGRKYRCDEFPDHKTKICNIATIFNHYIGVWWEGKKDINREYWTDIPYSWGYDPQASWENIRTMTIDEGEWAPYKSGTKTIAGKTCILYEKDYQTFASWNGILMMQEYDGINLLAISVTLDVPDNAFEKTFNISWIP